MIDVRTFVNLEFVTDMVELMNIIFIENDASVDLWESSPITTKTSERPPSGGGGDSGVDGGVKGSATTTTSTDGVPVDSGDASDTVFKLTCQLKDTEIVLLKDPHRSITPSIVAHVSSICFMFCQFENKDARKF